MNLVLPLAETAEHARISPLLMLPFGLLLLLIATMPLSPAKVKHFWEHNYHLVALGLAAFVAAFYLWKIPEGGTEILRTSKDYFSFIVLIGSLFVVAGGIHIKTKGEATPLQNVIFLLLGGLLANFVGTTGASMVMIRPYIRMNKIRISAYHIVFFIFIVSNVGGALTPIGDPPLFLGFLRGVPFFWLPEKVMPQWLATMGMVLFAFYLFDRHFFARVPKNVQREIAKEDTWKFEGAINVFFLLAIIGAVFLEKIPFLREAVMIGAGVASYFLTPKNVHQENAFSFGPIKEVAFLFAGIFMTMMPALGYIDQNGESFNVKKPAQYYFASGSLSSVLDNAPTYATFLRLAESTAKAEHPQDFVGKETEREIVQVLLSKPEYSLLVIAVSLGSVFFGAMTYIGNGPNFMVKSIAESAGVKVPTFFGYIFKYSLPILLPILAIGAYLFL
jgi:Na+/H+ antiporter NhaD/arsenite permease-like protein